MFCTNCGNQIPDGAKFCVHCGAPVGQKASVTPEPVYQQTQQVYQQPAHVTRSMPAVNQAYQQPYVAPYAAPANKRVTSKWPVSTGVMGILYFVFTLISFVPYLMYYVDVVYFPEAFFNAYRIIHILLVIAVPVLFFVHTKKVAFITAIPMFIMLVMDLISFFANVRYYYSELLIRQLITIVPFFILVVLYVIQMIVRPRSAALPVIFLIFAIFYIILSFVSSIVGFRGDFSYLGIGALLSWFAEIFAMVAYMIAMFSSRKR